MSRRSPVNHAWHRLPAMAAAMAACGCAEPQGDTEDWTRPDDAADESVAPDDGDGGDGGEGSDGAETDGEVGDFTELPDGCVPGCTLGGRECVDPPPDGTRYRLCIDGGGGCPAWGPPTECAVDTVCDEGECVPPCTDECTLDDRRCASGTETQTCEVGPEGCLAWGSPTACGEGLACSGAGECATCTDECDEGATQCASSREIRTCETGTGACRVWSASTVCPGTEVCWDGACATECTNLCTSGSRRCLGDQFQICQRFAAPTPCYGWSSPFDCPSGRACVGAGICPTCTDACTEGEARCDSDTTHSTCTRSPSTGCTSWGAVTPCADREHCEGAGVCTAICTDECTTPGGRECGPTGDPRECTVGAFGCNVWSDEGPCDAVANGSNVCVGGACTLTCDAGYEMCSPTSCRGSCTPWTQQSPIPAYEDLRAIDVVGTTVWAVGNSGVVTRSDDGGVTWRNAGFVPGGVQLNGVDFVGAVTGWAVGNGGAIFRTTDGGATWAAQVGGVATSLRAVSFFDATRGWAVGDGGVIRATTDGGTVWVPQASGLTTNLLSVHFVSATTGWAVGAGGRIIKTTNGGTSWTSQTGGTTYDIFSVRFVDANVGWAAGGYYVYRTTNGGTSWSAFNRAVLNYYGVWPLSSSAATVVGASGRIETTTDGGLGWSVRTSGTALGLYAVAFVDATNAVTVGQSGTTLSSSNAGVTWIDRRGGTTDALRSIRFADSSNGWAVGASGRIVATTDGGRTFTPQTSGTARNLWDVWFVDASRGWAVGENGTILATTDGGAAWTPQASMTTSNLYGVHFADANNGWAVGTVVSGTPVLYTPDGGTTWQPMRVSGVPASTVYAVWFDACSGATCNGWMVGTSGTVRYTTNYGTSWLTPSSVGTSQTLYGVRFVSATVGFAVGAGGTLIVTTNGGTTWTPRGTGVSTTLYDVDFVSATDGFIAGAAGTFIKTTDGGTAWNTRVVPTSRDLRGVSFVDDNIGWVAGDSGTILSTRSAGD